MQAPEEEAEAAIRRADRSLYADKERRRYGRLLNRRPQDAAGSMTRASSR